MMPKQSDIELPLLEVLARLDGGQGRPRDIYPLLQQRFPELTQQDLEERLQSGTPKWTNRVQWVRQALVSTGEVRTLIAAVKEKRLNRNSTETCGMDSSVR